MNKNNQSSDPKDILGFKELHAKYKSWILSLPADTLKKYAIFAAVIILVLPTIATLLERFIPQAILVALSFPAGIGLFLYVLGIAFVLERKKPERVTIKERFSFLQRLKGSVAGGIVTLGIIIALGKYLPYAFGGVLVLATALAIYNILQRTPLEIEFYEKGITDPRDEQDILRNAERQKKATKKGKRSRKEVEDE